MSRVAVDIAISEITGIPLESLCGYVLIGLQHHAGGHTLGMFCMDNDFKTALRLAEQGLVGLRESVKSE